MHGRTVQEGTEGNGLKVERFRHEDITTEALVHSRGLSIDLSSANRGIEWVDDLPKLVSQLVINPENRIPTEPGFCVDRAYFRDPLTADQGERITAFARLPSHPDVEFTIILSAGQKPDEQGILERSRASGGSLSLWERLSISTSRAVPRMIAGLPGEELVETFVENNDARVHSFWWEVKGTEHNVLIPRFVLKMDTGKGDDGPVPSSLSKDAAFGLWDMILSSIRVRPYGQNKRGTAVPGALAAR